MGPSPADESGIHLGSDADARKVAVVVAPGDVEVAEHCCSDLIECPIVSLGGEADTSLCNIIRITSCDISAGPEPVFIIPPDG